MTLPPHSTNKSHTPPISPRRTTAEEEIEEILERPESPRPPPIIYDEEEEVNPSSSQPPPSYNNAPTIIVTTTTTSEPTSNKRKRGTRKKRSTIENDEAYYTVKKDDRYIMELRTDSCHLCCSVKRNTKRNVHHCYKCYHYKKAHQDETNKRHQCPIVKGNEELITVNILANLENISQQQGESATPHKRRRLNNEEPTTTTITTTLQQQPEDMTIPQIHQLIKQKKTELNYLKAIIELKFIREKLIHTTNVTYTTNVVNPT